MASWMWIIGGLNGAGKSTFAGPYLNDPQAAFPDLGDPTGIVKLNADELPPLVFQGQRESYLSIRAESTDANFKIYADPITPMRHLLPGIAPSPFA